MQAATTWLSVQSRAVGWVARMASRRARWTWTVTGTGAGGGCGWGLRPPRLTSGAPAGDGLQLGRLRPAVIAGHGQSHRGQPVAVLLGFPGPVIDVVPVLLAGVPLG